MNDRISHFSDEKICVAMRRHPDNDNICTVAISRTHPADQYNRKKGRFIAVGRLDAERNFCVAMQLQEYYNWITSARDCPDVGGARDILMEPFTPSEQLRTLPATVHKLHVIA